MTGTPPPPWSEQCLSFCLLFPNFRVPKIEECSKHQRLVRGWYSAWKSGSGLPFFFHVNCLHAPISWSQSLDACTMIQLWDSRAAKTHSFARNKLAPEENYWLRFWLFTWNVPPFPHCMPVQWMTAIRERSGQQQQEVPLVGAWLCRPCCHVGTKMAVCVGGWLEASALAWYSPTYKSHPSITRTPPHVLIFWSQVTTREKFHTHVWHTPLLGYLAWILDLAFTVTGPGFKWWGFLVKLPVWCT